MESVADTTATGIDATMAESGHSSALPAMAFFRREIDDALAGIYANGHALDEAIQRTLTDIAQIYVTLAACSIRPPFTEDRIGGSDKKALYPHARRMAQDLVAVRAPECAAQIPHLLDALDASIVKNRWFVTERGAGWGAQR